MLFNPKKTILFFSISLFLSMHAQVRYKIGLLVMATGKYIQFVEPLLASADQYFCQDNDVTYFIFTDGELQRKNQVIQIYQKRLGWPYDTLMRHAIYYHHRKLLMQMDYLFACDADMLFVDTIGNEILSNRVATLHPGFVGKRGSYETNQKSRACVAKHEGKHYYAGGFHGGNTLEFLNLSKSIYKQIDLDLKNNIIAVWHDESHLNRFFIDNPPTCILSPSYCYPESWSIPYPKKLLALDKNHDSLRQ